jgi:uncharacterized RDD family membrane protein YckC
MTTSVAGDYAGLVSRTVAYVLDALIVAALFTGGAAVASMIASVIGARAHDLARAAASAYLVVLPAMLAFYSTLFWALAGRTPGMAVLGLRVVSTRREALSWLSALVRGVVLAYFPIGALWALIDRRHQAVHDKLARTVVVRVPSTGHGTLDSRLTHVRRG